LRDAGRGIEEELRGTPKAGEGLLALVLVGNPKERGGFPARTRAVPSKGKGDARGTPESVSAVGLAQRGEVALGLAAKGKPLSAGKSQQSTGR
jgi:hypothetical protein